MNVPLNRLISKRLGIDTQNEYVVYMRSDCHICMSEGFESMTRIQVTANGHTIIATLNVVRSYLLRSNEASLSESAWHALNLREGDQVAFSHLQPVNSMSKVRAKIYGNTIGKYDFHEIIKDITNGKYSNIELSAFVTACSGDNLNEDEIIHLTEAMVQVGAKLSWDKKVVVDKHCVGGLPGNRTTPIIVAIVAAAGLTIPKTSSHAITSPAGTAEAMKTMAPVDLSLAAIREVVRKEGGCVAWGGAVDLSPADDILIKVEQALDVDSEGQMIASVLSKKVAAGSTHVVIDIPVGPTAKVRSESEAQKLKYYFTVVGKAHGLEVKVVITDGTQPVGRGIGPALEAMSVLQVLRNDKDAPRDLRERALLLAGEILEIADVSPKGMGKPRAREILTSGQAYKKFIAICNAQGGFTEPVAGTIKHDVLSHHSGTIKTIDNRRLAKVAKLSGAPSDPGAGVAFFSPIGKKVSKGDLLFTIHSESKGELAYALNYLRSQPDIITFDIP